MKTNATQNPSGATPFPMDTTIRFSFERTLLSHERTVLSWIRTASSLITFGFTIYKFFQLELGSTGRPQVRHFISARAFAMVMIGTGLFALLAATIQNIQFRTNWRKQKLEVPLSLATLVGGAIAFLGLLAMAATVFRW